MLRLFLLFLPLLAGLAQAAPQSVLQRPVELDTGNGILRGTLLRPKTDQPVPVALIIAGSGPTDRDGNNPIGGRNDSLKKLAQLLARNGIASLRYQFPYMERGGKRPDPPKLAHATVRAAVAAASWSLPQLALVAGGKSFGGRMTSQAQAAAPLPGVRGLAFFGFPLHPAGRPSQERGQHLFDIAIPMLFLQGTRDALAQPDEIEPLLPGAEREIFNGHRLPGCGHLLLRGRPGEHCYLVYTRTMGKRFPFAHIHYLGNPQAFARNLDRVRLHLMLTLRTPLIMIDARLVAGVALPNSREVPLSVPHVFRSDSLSAAQIDNLYSELILLNL